MCPRCTLGLRQSRGALRGSEGGPAQTTLSRCACELENPLLTFRHGGAWVTSEEAAESQLWVKQWYLNA